MIHPVNTPCQYTLSTHPIKLTVNIYYQASQPILSTQPLHPPSLYPLSTHPLTLPPSLPPSLPSSTKKRTNPNPPPTTKTGGGGGTVVTGDLEVVSWTDVSHCVLLSPTLVKERPYSSSLFGDFGGSAYGNTTVLFHSPIYKSSSAHILSHIPFLLLHTLPLPHTFSYTHFLLHTHSLVHTFSYYAHFHSHILFLFYTLFSHTFSHTHLLRRNVQYR